MRGRCHLLSLWDLLMERRKPEDIERRLRLDERWWRRMLKHWCNRAHQGQVTELMELADRLGCGVRDAGCGVLAARTPREPNAVADLLGR